VVEVLIAERRRLRVWTGVGNSCGVILQGAIDESQQCRPASA
jgi:hypothetical protein